LDNKRVLVVDDDSAICELLKIFLETHDCTVTTETGAEGALAQIRIHQFDLVLLDIMLGEYNGLQVLQSIKKVSPQVSVIMITGDRDIVLAKKCLDEGADDYISKPFDFEYLRESVFASLFL